MQNPLPTLLSHAPLGLLVLALLAAGLGLPLPEDLVLLTAGGLSHRGGVALPLTVAVCAAGVLGGDLILFLTARRLGPAALSRRPFRALLPPERRTRIEGMLRRRGPAVIFVARHLAGIRAPTFALAGIHGMPLRTFLMWDALGACVSVPLTVVIGYLFSEHLDRVGRGMSRVEHWVAAAAVTVLCTYLLVQWLRRRRDQAPANPPADDPGQAP